MGAVQGAMAGVVLPVALGYDLARGSAFFGLALLAGVAFALVVQGLSALLGGFGRFVAFALLVVAFAVGIVSTVPGPLAAVGDASPIGAALGGFQAVATGASGAGIAAVARALGAGRARAHRPRRGAGSATGLIRGPRAPAPLPLTVIGASRRWARGERADAVLGSGRPQPWRPLNLGLSLLIT
jgi:hypothetical protein